MRAARRLPEMSRLFGTTQRSVHVSAPIVRAHCVRMRSTRAVRRLLQCANATWLLNIIVILQPRARRARWLRDFQLWELFSTPHGQITIVCSFDSENVAFQLTFGRIECATAYVRVYVKNGIVCTTAERRRGRDE